MPAPLFPRALPAALLLATAAHAQPAVDTVRVDGSPGVAPLVTALARAFEARTPGVVVRVASGLGSGARVRAVAEGAIDVAMASHGVVAEELAARGVVAHEIARAAVVFAVHRTVPVAGLTARQVCDAYAGAVTDWRRLGGPALAIAPLTRPAGEVDADVVLAGVPCLRDVPLAPTVRTLGRPEEMAAALAATPGALGITSLPFVRQSGGRVRALAFGGAAPTAANVRRGAYPLTRASILLTAAAPRPPVARFLAFVRGPAGARVISAGGAVPTAAR
jgi:phosphate transport system substrate-binding protein